MTTYRVGRSWGVTVVREQPGQPDQLVGTMQRLEDAQLVVNALNLMDEAFGEPLAPRPAPDDSWISFDGKPVWPVWRGIAVVGIPLALAAGVIVASWLVTR